MTATEKVIIRRCDRYEPDRIRAILREGLAAFDRHPSGRVMRKPNVVMAHREVLPCASASTTTSPRRAT